MSNVITAKETGTAPIGALDKFLLEVASSIGKVVEVARTVVKVAELVSYGTILPYNAPVRMLCNITARNEWTRG